MAHAADGSIIGPAFAVPDNLKTAFDIDASWWADNGDQLKERFNAWLAK